MNMRRARCDVTSATALPSPLPLLLGVLVAAATTAATTAATAATTTTATTATTATTSFRPGNMTINLPAGSQGSGLAQVTVFGVSVGAGRGWGGARELLAGRLRAAGVRAAPGPALPPRCDRFPRDSLRALHCTVMGMVFNEGGAVVVGVPVGGGAGGYLAQMQRWAHIRVLDAGDAAPPVHRACRSSQPELTSLADLAHRARLDRLHWERIDSLNLSVDRADHPLSKFTPNRCNNTQCVTLLVSDATELEVMRGLVEGAGLYALVLVLDTDLHRALAPLPHPSPWPLLLCAWEVDLVEPQLAPLVAEWTEVTPLPCNSSDYLVDVACPFERRRLAKLVQESTLEQNSNLDDVLYDFNLTAKDLEELGEQSSPASAATAWLARHQDRVASWVRALDERELNLVVLLPISGTKRTWDSVGLLTAAGLARQDMNFALNVELRDAQCSATGAILQVAMQLSRSKYKSLTALAGPACGAAAAGVATLTQVYRLPMLAYTPAAVPDSHWALLAGGAGRDHGAALVALMQRLGWRRLAVLFDSGSRFLLDPAHLLADFVPRTELPDGEEGRVDETNRSMIIEQWVQEAKSADARVLLLAVEETSVAVAALCAGRGAGLVPGQGAVWLLARTPRGGWLDDADAECAREAAEGLLAVGPAWERHWDRGAAGAAWSARWREERQKLPSSVTQGHGDVAPEPAVALLYDVLVLWSRAWARINATAADAHSPKVLKSLIHEVIKDNDTTLTGRFAWSENLAQKGEVRARRAPLLVTQWRGGVAHEAGHWAGGTLEPLAGLRWMTADGRPPPDGSPRCALQPLADLLGGDCHAALATVLVLVGLALLAVLAGGALWSRRRRDQARLEHVRMRSLPTVDRWEVPRERIVINRKLGVGAFGAVYGGHAKLTSGGWIAVAVKTLRPGASIEEKADFLSEAETMKRFEHKNVVRLLGVVTQTEPMCTVMEYLLYADLKVYLLARRHLAGEAEADSKDEVSPRRLTSMALDVAHALSYLADKRYVHRDVAARNCLVSARRQLKLADFGMTRPVLDNDYYRFGRKGMLPVRWMAPESLTLGVFSPASDVWAFGVLLYEMVTFGALPYQGLSNHEVLAHVKLGGTLDLPLELKPSLKALMKQCWAAAAAERPPAHELVTFLAERPRLLTPCLDAPLDALPLTAEPLQLHDAQTRWEWGAPASVTTETTYLSDSPPEACLLPPSQ